MIEALKEWHAVRNAAVAAEQSARARQFGLTTVGGAHGQPAPPLCCHSVWAWQAGDPAGPAIGGPFDIRVGFAGRRLHLGHLTLARDLALIQQQGHTVAMVAQPRRDDGSARAYADLIDRVIGFGGRAPDRLIDLDTPDVLAFKDEVLAHLTLRRVRQVYGCTSDTRMSLMQDVATMMVFFLYEPASPPPAPASVALVDAAQAPHTALMRTVARRLGVRAPLVAYRRLLPDLQARGGRASARDPGSTIFLDQDPDTVRRTFMRAVTGGRASAAEQRMAGGDATRCPVFEIIELVCPAREALRALRRCTSGSTLCHQCKSEHVDAVVTVITDTAPRRVTVSPAVAPALVAETAGLHRPPPREPIDLEAAIARYAGVHAEQVVVGTGSTQLLDWIVQDQRDLGGRLIATAPTFELYEDLAARHGVPYVPVAWTSPKRPHDTPCVNPMWVEGVGRCRVDRGRRELGRSSSAR